MDLNAQLKVLRRHWFLIVEAIVLAVAVAALVGRSQSTSYQSSAQVLLQPGDPTESISAASQPADLDQYSATQAQIVTSPPVARLAASRVNSSDPSGLASQVSVGGTSILVITATDGGAKRAQNIANAFADAYLTYGRETAVQSLKHNAATLKTQLAVIQKQLDDTTSLTSAALSALHDQYSSVYGQYVTATINQSLARGNATLLASASAPTADKGTPLVETLIFAALAGLMLGLGAVVVREQLDDKIRTREDAERASGALPILTETPDDRRSFNILRKHGIETAMITRLGESGRALRTAVMFFGIRHEERRILVTSPNPGDGKTLTSVLLAASYAQAGFRTVLVAADLRHSDVERLLRVAEPDPLGLSDALVSPSLSLADSPEDDAPRHIVATDLANLWLLPAGTSAPNPTELLGSRRMTELLDELSLSFDIVVIDTAPVLPVADTRTLVESVDGVLLVSSIGASRRDLARTRDILKLADVNWLGLVLNRTTDVAASPYHEQRPTRRSRAGV